MRKINSILIPSLIVLIGFCFCNMAYLNSVWVGDEYREGITTWTHFLVGLLFGCFFVVFVLLGIFVHKEIKE